MLKKISNNLFIISFLPAIAYWYLEANYPVKVAVVGGFLLSLVEISFEKYTSGKLHQISKLNFFLMVLMGALSFAEENGIWFKLTPGITSVCMGIFLLINIYFRKVSILMEMNEKFLCARTKSRPIPMSSENLKLFFGAIERHLAIFFIFYGVVLLLLAVWGKTSTWVFFKTAGFFISFLFFLVFEYISLKLLMRPRVNS
ncbi:MAG: septation protein IspZ [Oligoflexia bacterium]|nr:septation protein IspZ [Oligoflexia bacterium]